MNALLYTFIADGRTIFSLEYPVRSNTSTPFRQIAITSDNSYLAVPAADKGNRDCITIYSAKTGTLVSKIPIKVPGFKVTKNS
jgi:hypothetical protein